MTVHCQRCPKSWERDPVLEVECPTCGRPPGSKCVERAPSGHVKSALFGGLGPWGHDERDFAALAAGAYGTCPKGVCPTPNDVDQVRARYQRRQRRTQSRKPQQEELFA